MGIGEVSKVTIGSCDAMYYVDIGLYGTPGYGAIYILDTDRPAVIDSGTGANYDLISNALNTIGITRNELSVIALTHVHLDHAGGAGRLVAEYPNAEVFVHSLGRDHLLDPTSLVTGTKRVIGELWEYHREPSPIPNERVHAIQDGASIDLGDRELKTFEVPGHAPHQVVFYDPVSDALFTADAAGMRLPGPELLTVTTPPPNFNLDHWLESHVTMTAINPETLLYPHFGPVQANGIIAEHEQLLIEWVGGIQRKREALEDDAAVVKYFLEQSDLRAAFGEPAGSIPTQFNVRGVLQYLTQQHTNDPLDGQNDQ